MSWPHSEIERLTAQYGTVPPPWIPYPEFHPLSAFWRMGGGEGHIMLWGQWWDSRHWDEAQRLAYFRTFPPPPRWLLWVGDAIWGSDSDDELEEDAVLERLEGLGFGSRAEFLADWEDERWE
ncbi:hypothetical protein [Deinococcus puniceus]|uniref:Uncharacterized protein n=1 Tax=Deinococcus puniceus TaxID=1182568 RepID=A0A172T760_9DEIO|nr:hypothetical protein [Deinococcus puniceus]ANE42859.1 hypothetical protein SU48_02745 [Deinococcus puniceus]